MIEGAELPCSRETEGGLRREQPLSAEESVRNITAEAPCSYRIAAASRSSVVTQVLQCILRTACCARL